MFRGGAVPKMAAVVGEIATHLCPSRSHAPCLARMPAQGHRSFTGSASLVPPEVPQTNTDLFEIHEHTVGKSTFSKRAFPATTLVLRVDRFCSRQLSRMHGAGEEGCGTVLALQPHRTP